MDQITYVNKTGLSSLIYMEKWTEQKLKLYPVCMHLSECFKSENRINVFKRVATNGIIYMYKCTNTNN